jgi:hypothetical protein
MNDQVLGHKKLPAVKDGKPLYKKALELLQQAKGIFDEGLYFEGQEPSGRADIEDTVLMHACDDLDTAIESAQSFADHMEDETLIKARKVAVGLRESRAGFPAHRRQRTNA